MDSPVLQESSILELLALGGDGAAELIVELIDLYIEDSVVRVEDARQGFQSSDSGRVSRAAHALKSSSANMGAMELSRLCAQLEGLGSDGEVDPSQLEQLVSMHREVEDALRELRAAYAE